MHVQFHDSVISCKFVRFVQALCVSRRDEEATEYSKRKFYNDVRNLGILGSLYARFHCLGMFLKNHKNLKKKNYSRRRIFNTVVNICLTNRSLRNPEKNPIIRIHLRIVGTIRRFG